MYLLVVLPSFMQAPVTYKASSSPCLIGHRVLVPFGKSKKVGIIIAHQEHCDLPPHKIKTIIRVLDQEPLLPQSHIAFLKRTAQYYHHSINQITLAALPALLLKEDTQCDPLYYTSANSSNLATTTPSQSEILALAKQPVSLFCLLLKFRAKSVQSLIDTHLLVKCDQPKQPVTTTNDAKLPLLSPAQQACLTSLQSAPKNTCVFWGITGCGKTEVYAHLIHQTLQLKQQVLILVPEIALTPQTVQKIAKRIGFEPSILHSNQAIKQRGLNWLSARHLQSSVIIGTRSAILSALPNLGLIIVDEEHSESYRQDTPFFYSARDAAILRANLLNIPVILGSATPSLETLHNVNQQKYSLFRLKERYNAVVPRIQLITLKPNEVLSPSLIPAVQQELAQNHHVMLFIGKRGYSRISSCHNCGFQHRCDGCDRLLVCHTDQQMHCHHCELRLSKLEDCPKCQQSELSHWGAGSQTIMELAEKTWPGHPVIRVDTDNLSNKEAALALQSLAIQPATIIVGTQMITKGHDIDRLNMVVVMNNDHHLYSSDFRSEEKLYCELLQVAGRSGRRAQQGNVYIQTQSPNHILYTSLNNMDQGYEYLLKQRASFLLPPYRYIACLFIRGPEKQLAFLNHFHPLPIDGCEIDGPMFFPAGKRRGLSCYQVMITAAVRAQRTYCLKSLKQQLHPLLTPRISVICQVDSHLSL